MTAEPAAPLVAPVLRYRTPGICGHGPGPCGAEGARLYPAGWRCDQHSPARMAGRPEPQPGPGWPAHRDTP